MESGTINIWKTLQRGVPKMHRGAAKRLRVSEVNPHLICVLCGGYYIDATTITECLHTFCKTCIVGYLEASKHCPVCDNLVHKTKPHLRLRPDHTLQDLVYKLVPGLFQDEMKKRREFYKDEIQNGKLGDTGLPEERERIVYSGDELISLVLELSHDGQPPINPGSRVSQHKIEAADRRFLQCPANLTINHLKKFIRMKFNLCDRYQVDFYHTDESLHDHYTLVDVAYIYSWRRQGPLRLYYTVFTNPAKKFKADIDDIVHMETDIIDKSDSRGETSGYLSSDDLDKSHDRSTDSGVSLGESYATNESTASVCSKSLNDSGVVTESIPSETDKSEDQQVNIIKDKSAHTKSVNGEHDKGNDVEQARNRINKSETVKRSGSISKSKQKLDITDRNHSTNKANTGSPCSEKHVHGQTDKVVNIRDTPKEITDKPIKPTNTSSEIMDTLEKHRDTSSIITDKHAKPKDTSSEITDKPATPTNTSCEIMDKPAKPTNTSRAITDKPAKPKDTSSEITDKPAKPTNTSREITDKPFRESEKYVDIKRDSFVQTENNSKTSNKILRDVQSVKQTSESASSTECDSVEVQTKSVKLVDPIKRSVDRETVTRNTAETSTCTSPIPLKDVRDNESVSKVSKQRVNTSDDDVSEPVVSSTQNTQGCQTEPPESYSDTLDLPHSSEEEDHNKSVCQKSKVDVSCGTDNFDESQEVSVEKVSKVSVSVSTDTEHAEADSKGKVSKECSTDIWEFSDAKKERKSVDCSTDFEGFPGNNNKRKALAVDCSTGMDDFEISSSKKKVVDSATVTESKSSKESKKSDIKAPKRSISYGGYTSTPKSAYQAQPLSPTKITLKFTSPKSPNKTLPKALVNSRAEPTGFQSQYQSFVMELPHKAYEFHDDSPNPTSSDKSSGPFYKQTTCTSSPTLLSSAPKKLPSKTGRPRGRPPKNRPVEMYTEPQKEKKHKSRSHSPKHRRHSDKSNDSHKDKYSANIGEKRKSVQSPSRENAKQTSTPYNWINKIDTGSKQISERKLQKSKSESADKSSAELKIPKQFLFFSNGQYTLASESTFQALKQSSPVSPTRTVSVADTKPSSYGDKHNISVEKPKDTKRAEPVAKQGVPKVFAKTESKTSTHTAVTQSNTPVFKEYVQSDIKTDSNQNKLLRTPTPSKSQCSPVSSSDSGPIDVRKTASPAKCPEYRHQSPFFASLSGAKLGQTHRIGTHLNIPNLSSHFSGTHHLYAHARYSAERMAQPSNLYRSFSMTEKSPPSPNVNKFQDKQRMESVPSPCGYLPPFPTAYLGLPHIHSHMMSSLPPAGSPKGYSPDSTRSPTHAVSEQNTHIGNSSSQTNSVKNVIKSPGSCRKGKEKSIDNIITAITEMRAKQEEQLNGIDLSTKSSRQTDKSSSPNHAERLDKYAFTDEDEVRVAPSKSGYKSEHVPYGGERKNAV